MQTANDAAYDGCQETHYNSTSTEPTLADAKTLVGVLQFASNVIVLGKAYIAEIRKIIDGTNAKARFGRAPPHAKFESSNWLRHAADMWCALIEKVAVRSACIGVRRPA